MDVVPDRSRYSVGDTATVLFASPFTDADAWVTVEREGLIEQRRIRITSGSTTIKFPITEAWAPNAFVSIVVSRGRSAPPGPLDDPGRPTIRVGYADLRVTPEVKRLTVTVAPALKEYRPGDTARVNLKVSDRGGRGQRSEVTLWAVDEGVLALTGYRTPDPLDLIYRERGLGLRLASNLTTVAPQVPEGEKGARAPGGGGGQGESDLLRSRFKTTAFFLGSVITDSSGRALASARLPDNLTTFRLMAVAVTAGDRYGKGESSLLVTRPLLARPALPRFLREGDRFEAGVVVNQRAGGTPTVTVRAEPRGTELTTPNSQTATLEAGRGREVRFGFRQPGGDPVGGGDSASFRFRVSGGGDADLVEQRLGIKPAFRPRAWTVSGVLVDSAMAEFALPDGLDPARSRLTLTLGSSPLSVIRGLAWELRVYPYYCSEQVSSTAQPLIALYRVQAETRTTLLKGNPRREIETAVGILTRRQRVDGGIGYWGSDDWTTPWLSAYAGITLLDARAAGIAVDDSMLARLAGYLRTALDDPQPIRAPVVGWYDQIEVQLGDKVAAVDFLSRLGKAHVAAENELLRSAAQLSWEDRARLAEVLARRGAIRAARSLLDPAWKAVKVEGRRADRARGGAARRALLQLPHPARRPSAAGHARGGLGQSAHRPAGRDAGAAGAGRHPAVVEHPGLRRGGLRALGLRPPGARGGVPALHGQLRRAHRLRLRRRVGSEGTHRHPGLERAAHGARHRRVAGAQAGRRGRRRADLLLPHRPRGPEGTPGQSRGERAPHRALV